MLRKYYIFVLIIILILGCDKNPTKHHQSTKISSLSGPTIIYDLSGERSFKNRFLNSDKDDVLFDGNNTKSFIRISPNKNNIAYVKNYQNHIFGIQNNEDIPAVCVSDINFENEISILKGDSSNIYCVEWINNKQLAISSYEEPNYYIYILNENYEIIEKKEVNNFYGLYMLPDSKHLLAYRYDKFGLFDVFSNNFIEFNPNEEIATYTLPFFIDNKLILRIYGNKYYNINLENYTCSEDTFSQAEDNLIYANDVGKVCYNYNNKELKLYINNTMISTIEIKNYLCDSGLNLTSNYEMYLIAESNIVDDESVILKVNFNTKTIECLTNHGEDKFINDARYYQL